MSEIIKHTSTQVRWGEI